MSDKPTYLSLLNAIAVNEARSHRYLQAWIEKTDDPEVKAVLQKVSWREGEHGWRDSNRTTLRTSWRHSSSTGERTISCSMSRMCSAQQCWMP